MIYALLHAPHAAPQCLPTLSSCVDNRANADEMAASLQDLGTMQTIASGLRGRMLEVDAALSRVGKAYLNHLIDCQEHTAITSSLTQSLQVCA